MTEHTQTHVTEVGTWNRRTLFAGIALLCLAGSPLMLPQLRADEAPAEQACPGEAQAAQAFYEGYRHESGMAGTIDMAAAAECYRRAAELGFAPAQSRLGCCYDQGKGVTKDRAEAMVWYLKAAEQGDAEAMVYVAEGYRWGLGGATDLAQAEAWYRKAVERKHALAEFSLSELLRKQKLDAELQNQERLARLADFRFDDQGVEQHREEAEKLCQEGDNYLYGWNGKRIDLVKSVDCYHRAATWGNLDALSNLAFCYMLGFGIPKDEVISARLFLMASERGHAHSMHYLGNMYRDGSGVEKDMEKAAEWYRKGAALGDRFCQFRLAECYMKGEGVHKDEEEAIRFYGKAADQGETQAAEALRRLGK